MTQPRNFYVLTALICLTYLLYTLVQGKPYDAAFLIALIGLFASLGAWKLKRKKKN